MSFIKTKKCALAVAIAPIALLSTGTTAAELDSGVYIAPSLSYHTFGKNIKAQGVDIDNASGFGISLGYQFEENWAAEFAFHKDGSTEDDDGNDADSEYFHIDGLYHFDNYEDTNWSPYAVAGVGIRTYDIDDAGFNNSDGEFNAGVGVKYAFNSNLYFRTDARLSYGIYDDDIGSLWNIGFVYIFGGSDFMKDSDFSLNDYFAEVCGDKDKNPMVKEKPEPMAEPEAMAEPEPEPIAEPEPAVVSAVPMQQAAPIEAANELDTDNDGVKDSMDKCPETLFGAKVDETGCYAIEQAEEVEFNLNVTFKSGSTWLDRLSREHVDELANFLTVHSEVKVVIEGYSDSQGPAIPNKNLSQGRADSVRDYLIKNHKIEATKITAVGYGEESPIADNATADGRTKNRRVMAKVTAIEKQ